MLDSLFSLLTLILNTPLFYLIGLLIVLGYIYAATQRQMRQIRWNAHHRQPHQRNDFTQVRMATRHSEAVLCDECGRNVDHIAVRHTEGGERLLLCHSCSKQFGKMQRALYH